MNLRNVARDVHWDKSNDSNSYSSEEDDSSEFHVEEFRSVLQALDRAEAVIVYLKHKHLMPRNPTAIFDLDETVLKYIGPNEDSDFPRKFPGMGDFIVWLRRHGIQVCYITARRERGRRETVATLKNLRVWNDGDELLMKPDDAPSHSSSIVKNEQRMYLTNKGYSILINVGDQLSDMIPKTQWKMFLKDALKLPNHFSLKIEIKKARARHETVGNILEYAMANLSKTLLFWQLEDNVLLSIKMRNQDFFTR